MKETSRIGVSVFGAALLLSAGAFAKSVNKGSLHLADNVTVNGTSLQPGDYKVEWNGNGPNVQVDIREGSHTIATFPAQVMDQKQPPDSDAYGSKDEPNGEKALTAIYFGGKHYSLQIETGGTQQPAS